jgi:hypothetical protein
MITDTMRQVGILCDAAFVGIQEIDVGKLEGDHKKS